MNIPDWLHPQVQQILAFENDRAYFLARPSVMLGVVPELDGDTWCALFGDNLMEGVAGFGTSPDDAMRALDVAWFKKKENPK